MEHGASHKLAHAFPSQPRPLLTLHASSLTGLPKSWYPSGRSRSNFYGAGKLTGSGEGFSKKMNTKLLMQNPTWNWMYIYQKHCNKLHIFKSPEIPENKMMFSWINCRTYLYAAHSESLVTGHQLFMAFSKGTGEDAVFSPAREMKIPFIIDN